MELGVRNQESGGLRSKTEHGHRGLMTWQRADELAHEVYRALNSTDRVPRWLASQVGRAALSVPANIVEGYARGPVKEYLHFLEIARGSLAEAEYHVEFMAAEELLAPADVKRLVDLASETSRLLNALMRSVAEKQRTGSWERRFELREGGVMYHASGE